MKQTHTGLLCAKEGGSRELGRLGCAEPANRRVYIVNSEWSECGMTGKRKKNGKVDPLVRMVDTPNGSVWRFIDLMRGSLSRRELKKTFREALFHFGFIGLVSDRSLCSFLRDEEILNPNGPSRIGSIAYDICSDDLYNDIVQRTGSSSVEYIIAIERAGNKQFESSLGRLVRNSFSSKVTPFLSIADSPNICAKSVRRILDIVRDFGHDRIHDVLNIPISRGNELSFLLCLLTGGPQSVKNLSAGVILANTYHDLCIHFNSHSLDEVERDGQIALGATQIECIGWAVAGKTVDDIARLTGLSVYTVRYHMDRARLRYGYATMQQTLVRAARDYNLDPLGPSRFCEANRHIFVVT